MKEKQGRHPVVIADVAVSQGLSKEDVVRRSRTRPQRRLCFTGAKESLYSG
jgi:hypothetical protein